MEITDISTSKFGKMVHSRSLKNTIERPKKKMKKGIFISYSPDAGFQERAFVSDLVRQLKENNMVDDIWFDKDENCIDNPTWFSQRMEAVERCQAAILILSESYFSCPVSIYEARVLIEREFLEPNSVRVFPIKFNNYTNHELLLHFEDFLVDSVDLTTQEAIKLSIPEKTSIFIRDSMNKLEKFAVLNTPLSIANDVEQEFNGEYKKKKICQWSVPNLQDWLGFLGIKEFYRQNFAERLVDGFLVLSITDTDMVEQLGIDNRVVRKKLLQSMVEILEREHKLEENWHLRARGVRPRPNTLYLIYDPADVRLVQSFKQDLLKKGVQVIHHHKLGQSKEEFLRLNGPFMATASHIILILTDNSSDSPFVFHESMFADWLGKKILAVLFKNNWKTMRPAMRAVLGQCLAIDFERNMYAESMDILEHYLKPFHSLPGVVLEQSYLAKMNDGIKPLAKIAAAIELPPVPEPLMLSSTVFISFQWDMKSKVEEIQQSLELNGLTCCSDLGAQMRGHSSLSNRSLPGSHAFSFDGRDNHQSNIHLRVKNSSLVICCVTPKYLHSENCVHDLKLAESLKKPVVVVLLRFCSWPPDAALPSVKKTLAKCSDILEMYNDKLFKQNLPTLVERVKKILQTNH